LIDEVILVARICADCRLTKMLVSNQRRHWNWLGTHFGFDE
jgi:hypothetical protein